MPRHQKIWMVILCTMVANAKLETILTKQNCKNINAIFMK